MKKLATALFSLSLIGLALPAQANSAFDIEVMTQNQFLGADLNPLLAAAAGGDPAQIGAALGATLARMSANNFPVRAGALAEQICDKQPHVVGLQEVFRFELDGFSGPPVPAPFVDHLVETLAAIDDDCGNYVVGASLKNVDVSQFVPGFGTVGFIDRDVILVRDDVGFAPVPFSGNTCLATESGADGVAPSGCHFQALVPLPPLFGGAVLRGYLGVDAVVGGSAYRVVNTHLEVQRPDGSDISSIIQAFQAFELIGVLDAFPAPPDSRILVLGDINSSPSDPILSLPGPTTIVPPYTQLVGAGYTDVWNLRPGKPAGSTCCYDEDLSVTEAIHDERIDVIFSKVAPSAVKANVLGGKLGDRVLGLAPSDHCSVTGELAF